VAANAAAQQLAKAVSRRGRTKRRMETPNTERVNAHAKRRMTFDTVPEGMAG